MQTLRSLAVAVFALFLVSAIAVAEDKEKPKAGKTKDLIVGKWEMVYKFKVKDEEKEIKFTVEFTKDGKVTMTNPKGSTKGTYKVIDGKTIELSRKEGDDDKTEKLGVKVTKDTLEIKGPKSKQAMKFKRVTKKKKDD